MIIDTSAVMAVLLQEREADRILAAIAAAERPRMSAATYVECGIVLDRRTRPAGRRRFDELLTVLRVEVVDLTREQAELAREAHRDFGQGTGSAAGLNLGDCFTYALAATTGEPVIFVGDDFAATDLSAAEY
ncbi:type II toxin-antitoxin system VapC family toxin [Janibacter sp. YIM B02568]|uniref:type II toxin-antitoxin system VapC family toxin n=1 Tax=Janibacter endophyticus TaxID=2806261 RepID=UPI001950159D|nr:type II toxin-antitoxin system VapC family toxin [Janibacter endophyticus]MBM6546119.1 type II toxin-antitoxin system VapC family toxin [Janibacter endophyticus]